MGYCDGFYEEEEELSAFYEGVEEALPGSPKKWSADAAFVYSMRNKGKVDLSYMEKISGISTDELIASLQGTAIWPDPEVYEASKDYLACLTSKQQLLRGNLIKKYAKAKAAHAKYGIFLDTVELLKNALPDQVDPEDIHMNLGATWIPVRYIENFVKNILDMFQEPNIEYNSYLGKWTMSVLSPPNYVDNYYKYGTTRMNAVTIIKNILNAKPIKVYDQVERRDGRDGYDMVLNKAETLAASQKEKLILDAWQDYVRSDKKIEQHLQEIYMEQYGYSLCRYDGSFLGLYGLNPAVHLYEHQKNAVARIVLNHNTLLAHEVGAGKTMEYMCGVHELIRLGLGKKAMIVLPNNTLDQAVKTYQELYPQDKILTVYPKKDFVPAKREETIHKMATGDCRVILMAYSSFDMLSLTKDYKIAQKKQEMEACEREIFECINNATYNALQTKKKRISKELQKLEEEDKDQITNCFDLLGVDILVVDESHNYKNISLDNKTDSIVGVHNAGSKKADNMLEKVEYIQSMDGHVIFATGTPITNSMADLYVLQRYLQPNELKMCNIYHFNEWISTFCSQTHSFEIDVDSKNFRYTTRFSKFHNLPELMSMFSDVCDFYQIKDGELGLPDFDGYTDSTVKKSLAQKKYIDEIALRTEAIRAHKVKRSEDNLLKITVDGRKCALDIRLVEENATVGNDETKVRVCAKHIAELYFGKPGTTQIAFCDISTPKEGFNIYDELKKELIKLGVAGEEVAYIHEAETETKRDKIEKRFNAGDLRVLIGSTMKLGTGTNVQEKLVAIHHLDVPWRPADMIQREGRIIRQGNTNEKVYVYRYCTQASFDAYTWQILENKQRFIAQFLSGSMDAVHREESDCADTVLNYAEIKALAIGNPMIKKRVEVANELEHARINQRQRRKELNELKVLLDNLPRRIRERENMIRNAKTDIVHYRNHKKTVPVPEREALGKKILSTLITNVMQDTNRVLDTYQGFQILLPKNMKVEKPYVILHRPSSNPYLIKMDGDKALGCCRRLDYVLEHLNDTVTEYEGILDELCKQKKNAESKLDEGNEFDLEVARLIKSLEEIDQRLQEDKVS